MKSFCTIALNDKRNIIASIHPNLGNRRYRVACINELSGIIKETTLRNLNVWKINFPVG